MRLFLLTLLISFPSLLFSQAGKDSLMRLFQMTEYKTIQAGEAHTYLITQSKDSSPKGLIIFCQGSLPVPLLTETDQGPMGTFPFSHFGWMADYRMAIIAKPALPIYAHRDELMPNFSYHEGAGQPDAFRKRNYLSWFVQQGQKVLDSILARESIDSQKVILVGHSQGAKVAAKWAAQDPRITHLGYLSSNPMGRFDQYIRHTRQQEDTGNLTPEAAQLAIEDLYEQWAQLFEEEIEPTYQGDLPQTQISFSEPTYDDLLSLDIPIYVAYGTADLGARPCDLLPLDFIKAGKTNLTLKAYPGWEHNFFETLPDGKPDYSTYHWDEVMNTFKEWLEEH